MTAKSFPVQEIGGVFCAKALLLAGDGAANSRSATPLASSRPTVWPWRARLLPEGREAVRPGRGRQPRTTAS